MITWLRVLHIAAGAFWAGGAMVMGWFIAPAARKVGPAAGPFMQALLRARLADYMFGSAVVTVGVGLWLFFETGGLRSGWQGALFNFGALMGSIALVVGGLIQRPTAGKVQQLGAAAAGGPTPLQAQEMGMLQARLSRVASVTALLTAGAVIGMAIGG